MPLNGTVLQDSNPFFYSDKPFLVLTSNRLNEFPTPFNFVHQLFSWIPNMIIDYTVMLGHTLIHFFHPDGFL